jgi:predicted O-linked N-acetylglucosamine transferase (SPINDLY family)
VELHGPEKIARLPHSFWCFSPHDDEPPPPPDEARLSQHVTFGSLNNPAKITSAAIQLWCEALQAIPNSRLLLLSGATEAPALIARFQNEGIDAARIECVPPMPRPGYLRYYRRIDIVLDPFPYHGHSTSGDALLMGVPVMAFSPLNNATALPVSRAAASLLYPLGLEDSVVTDRAQWPSRVAAFARNTDRRRDLALHLHERMRSSPLMDAAAYTRALEAIYRDALQAWAK